MRSAANCCRRACYGRRGIAKILLVMKLTTLFFIIGLMQVSANGFSQHVSITVKNKQLTDVFALAKVQTGYHFLFKVDDLKALKPVSISVEKMPLADFMRKLLKELPLQFDIQDDNVVISKRTEILYLQQAPPITGTVRTAGGKPLSGASVRVKGSKKGAVTDDNGLFTIDAQPGETLVITYTGFVEREIKIDSDGPVNVVMQARESELEAVTVSTGYWTVEKRKSVGNISKVTAKDIENRPLTSPLMALQGRVPGVEVVPTTGTPGAAIKIRVRGLNSTRQKNAGDFIDGNLPLYVIDGVPVNSSPIETRSSSLIKGGFDPLATINPESIESISVLKDADATSIYGSRGANGVVLITTKNRNSSGTNLDAGITRRIGRVASRMDMLNTQEYISLRKEAYANDGMDYTSPDYSWMAPDLVYWDTTKYKDWQNVLLGHTSQITDANLRFSGGTERTSFNINAGYYKETLLFSRDFGYERYTGDLGINHRSKNDRLNIQLITKYGLNKHTIFNNIDLVYALPTFAPNSPDLYNEDGSLNWAPHPEYGFSTWMNPLAQMKVSHNANAYNINVNSVIQYKIYQGLTFRITTGISRIDQNEAIRRPIASFEPSAFIYYTPYGDVQMMGSERATWSTEPQLTYEWRSGDHNISSLAGLTFQQSQDETETTTGLHYSSDALLGTLAGARTVTSSTVNTQYRYNSVYARVGYDYKDRYIINVTARRDGSSRFGPGHKFANFGSVGVGWLFSEEPFMRRWPALSMGKIRASYGTTGNDQIGDAKFLKKYNIGTNTYNAKPVLIPNSLFNPDYQWEATAKFEVGLELGFIADRITMEAAWFRNNSDNQLVFYQLPATAGFPSVLKNSPAVVRNQGVELAVNAQQIRTKHFTWSTGFNISVVRNKLVAFPGLEMSPYARVYQIGQPLDMAYGFAWTGVDPATGLHTFEDIDGNGQVSFGDQRLLRSLQTNYFGGLTNNFSYRSFQLSFLVQFTERPNFVAFPSAPGDRGNQPREVLGRWQKPGDITNIQRASTSQSEAGYLLYPNYVRSSGAIRDVSFARLRTLSMAYGVPQVWLSKTGIKYAKLFLQGENLFTISNFEGWDPETIYAAPPLRIYSMGLQVRL